MALMRLTETICTPNDTYIRLSNDEITESLKEGFIKAGPRLYESTKETANDLIKDLESLRLQESVNSDILDRVLKNLKEANVQSNERKYYKFPVGRYGNVNANNRLYTEELWENVVTKQSDVWKGLCGLCDHPEGDSPGYFKDSSIVWLDMEIGKDGVVYGIGTFVGPYGHLAQEIIDCGGRVGFSSSGFGEVRSDRVVDPRTYQIERVADIVLNPSQAVFGDNSAMNMEYNKTTPVAGTGEQTGQLHESAPKSKIIQGKEKIMDVNAVVAPEQDSGLSKIEEKVFVKYVNNFLKEADEIKNPSERLKELAEILHTFEIGAAPELKKIVETKLIDERTKLETMIQETVEFKEEFGIESLKEFSESAKAVAMEAHYLNEENVNYKELCESLISHNKELKQENNKLNLKIKLRESRIERTTVAKNELSVYSESKVEELTSKLEETSSTLAEVTATNKELSSGNNSLEKKNENLKSRLTTTLTERDTLSADIKVMVGEVKSLRESRKETALELKTLKESNSKLNVEVSKLTENLIEITDNSNQLNESIIALNEENKQLSNLVSRIQLKEARYKTEAELAKRNLASLQEKVEIDSIPDAHVEPRFEDRVSGYVNFRENKGANIESYWGDLYNRYGEAIVPYEKHIRGAKTLREAQASFYKNMRNIDGDARVSEEARISTAVKASDRKRMLENAGYSEEREDISDLASVNERFQKNMPKDFK